jgi:hypothetical protein
MKKDWRRERRAQVGEAVRSGASRVASPDDVTFLSQPPELIAVPRNARLLPCLPRSAHTPIRPHVFPRSYRGKRPTAACGKIPKTKISPTMIHMVTRECRLTGIAVASTGTAANTSP